jgi:hypothetical protein
MGASFVYGYQNFAKRKSRKEVAEVRRKNEPNQYYRVAFSRNNDRLVCQLDRGSGT